MSDFNAYEFVADHAGMDIFEALSSVYQQGREEAVEECVSIVTNCICEEIRCAMCTNTMANDRGCDGCCVVDQDIYNRVITVVENRIEYAKNHIMEEQKNE